MRLVFLVPDLNQEGLAKRAVDFIGRRPGLFSATRLLPPIRDKLVHPRLHTPIAWGGTLNIMRHAALARSLGVEAVLASPSGRDTYGRFNIVDVPFIRWSKRRDDDVVVVPDIVSELADDVRGRVIVYLQAPPYVRANFDHRHPRVRLWTDSPFMLEKCVAVFPGVPIAIVPNIVDDAVFRFRPQSERERGLVFAFPRKGPEFIEATRARYAESGGTFWRFELVDGLSLLELAREMERPQAFLASADVEGCALPPQECMAAGIVVVGKSARGANFSMKHRSMAMVAETPEEAAACLRDLEDLELRERIARTAHDFIARYFPTNEPTEFWRGILSELERA
jgi:hypothetical protein